jgi:methyl-accepting chemotaxis protein
MRSLVQNPYLDIPEYMCKLHILDRGLDLGRKRVATMEKANRVAERLAETTGDSYKTVIDHVVGLQERNVRFAQGLVDDSIKELRSQVESNRAMTQELVERAEKQREAFQTLIEESVDAYMDLAYVPFSYYKEGLEAARKVVR